ncbi:MAG: peptidoglycan DD-metalloendopeptidase family protein [Rivularia sp. (in: cyanobacteria)]
MQPNLPNIRSTQDVKNSNILSEKNYRKFHRTALKLGFAISVGTASFLLFGQTNQAVGVEPVETNSVDDGTSEDFTHSRKERIANAILRQKVKVQNTASFPQQYRAQQSRYQQTAPVSIDSNNVPYLYPNTTPKYNQNPAPIVIPVPAPMAPYQVQVITSPAQNNRITNSIPVVTPNLPSLPPLAAIDRYLPRPIDENTAPPIAPDSTNTAYIWPTKGVLTSGYGPRWGRMHRGIDIANKIGTPIVAAADGVVKFEGTQRGYGKIIDISHADGSLTRYAHNHRHFVKLGQKVKQGQMIAHMGNTGFSTGPHLHFEIHPPGKNIGVNPIAYLPARV